MIILIIAEVMTILIIVVVYDVAGGDSGGPACKAWFAMVRLRTSLKPPRSLLFG